MPLGKLKSVFKGWLTEKSAESPAASASPIFRAPRIRIHDHHQVHLEIAGTAGSSTRHSIANISLSGVGFLDGGDDFTSRLRKVIPATLTLESLQASVQVELVHQTRGIIGARWSVLPTEFRTQLWNYLAPEKAGSECTRIRDELLRPESDGTPLSYISPTGNEFFLVVDSNGSWIRMSSLLFGTRLEGWNGKAPTLETIGRKRGTDRLGSETFETILLKTSRGERAQILEQFARFIEALPALEPKLRETIGNWVRHSDRS